MGRTKRSTRVEAATITQSEATENSDTVRGDEDLLSNPQGRSKNDVNSSKVNKEKLMKCRRNVQISTMNLRTLRDQHKREVSFSIQAQRLKHIGYTGP